MNVTRRKLLGAAAIAATAQSKSWSPTLGILGNFSEANVRFAKEQGFTSIGLFAHLKTTLDLSSPLPQQRIDQVQRSVKASGLRLSVIGFEALFKGFGASPYVGLQFDPSHLAWQMIDPVQAARDFVDKIFDVHLKDTEIRWPILRRVGVNPLNNEQWWRFRLPGSGGIDWRGFFTVLQDAGYQGALNIEHEDAFYYPNPEGENFTQSFQT